MFLTNYPQKKKIQRGQIRHLGGHKTVPFLPPNCHWELFIHWDCNGEMLHLAEKWHLLSFLLVCLYGKLTTVIVFPASINRLSVLTSIISHLRRFMNLLKISIWLLGPPDSTVVVLTQPFTERGKLLHYWTKFSLGNFHHCQ